MGGGEERWEAGARTARGDDVELERVRESWRAYWAGGGQGGLTEGKAVCATSSGAGTPRARCCARRVERGGVVLAARSCRDAESGNRVNDGAALRWSGCLRGGERAA